MSDVELTPKPVEGEPFIPYVPEAKFAANLLPIVEPYKKRMGFLPNALKIYAHRPEIAETLWKLNSDVMRHPSQVLPQFLKRKLAALASKTNGCAYCTAHSCSMLKKEKESLSEGWGLSEGDIELFLADDFQPEDEFERVCFDFVRSASADPAHVPGEIRDRLKKLLSPAQIVELACVVGFWKFYNTVHDALAIPVEGDLIEDTKFANG